MVCHTQSYEFQVQFHIPCMNIYSKKNALVNFDKLEGLYLLKYVSLLCNTHLPEKDNPCLINYGCYTSGFTERELWQCTFGDAQIDALKVTVPRKQIGLLKKWSQNISKISIYDYELNF